MVTVLFFARIREQLGVDRLSMALPYQPISLSQFKQHLVDSHNPDWSNILMADNVIKAVNQDVVDDNHSLTEGDEIAFFPPVTGG
ncbi:molybdopterin converting factor subunit 1 [Oceanicoccus sagamiensis]|uniref:Molybdopterin synthase sulfur carrier subunit n=1 Tax=Oceanicoccus sagamiensis TaxID=716816 RepID=A0A1X9NDI9_9GAMM|nr:molybdopterin converting factor subunit 1 [Oceanicoccus sagamiensis]ARN76108.1 molybdopterin converting factor subunit 1 [Oceanicoccus sagamiensis]